MTKGDIIAKIHEKLNISRGGIVRMVEVVFDVIKDTLHPEDEIMVSRFGKFIIRNKRRRRGRNPQTGGEMEITARRVLTFKPSRELKASLNKPKDITLPPPMKMMNKD